MALFFFFFFFKQFWGLGKEKFESKIIKNRPLCHYRHINSYTIVGLHTHFAIATSASVYSSLSPRLENSSCRGSPATPVPPEPQSSGHPPPTRGVAGPWETAEPRQHGIQMCSHVRLGNPVDCSPPGSSVHGTFQARTLEWVAISFSRGPS